MKLGISQASDQSAPTLESTPEGKFFNNLDEIADTAAQCMERLQKVILLQDKRIAELQKQIPSTEDFFRRRERELHKTMLEGQRTALIQIQQDHDMILQEAREAKEIKAAIDEIFMASEKQIGNILNDQRELFIQMQQDYDMILQEAQRAKENKAAIDEVIERMRRQTLPTRE